MCLGQAQGHLPRLPPHPSLLIWPSLPPLPSPALGPMGALRPPDPFWGGALGNDITAWKGEVSAGGCILCLGFNLDGWFLETSEGRG